MTTHSPVVLRELDAIDIFAVRSVAGTTTVKSVANTVPASIVRNLRDLQPQALLRRIQGRLRRSPDAFLARKVIIGEGRTEQGLLRGLDAFWSTNPSCDSFALRGAIAIDGGGNANAPALAEHLLALGYSVFLLVDTDKRVKPELVESIKRQGGMVHEWADDCSTEERLFLDVPWATVADLIKFSGECVNPESVLYNINIACAAHKLPEITDLALPAALDKSAFRRALGKAAKNERTPWFKDITRGEHVGNIVGKCLDKITATPLAQGIASLRQWVNG